MKVVINKNCTYVKPKAKQRVVVTKYVTRIITKGIQGPRGVAGLDGGSDYSYTAGENLSALVPCFFDSATSKVFKASNDSLSKCINFVGLSIESGIADGNIRIKRSGILNDSNWNWSTISDSTIYLSLNGTLTQIPPVNGFNFKIGFAMTATKIFIDPKQLVILQ